MRSRRWISSLSAMGPMKRGLSAAARDAVPLDAVPKADEQHSWRGDALHGWRAVLAACALMLAAGIANADSYSVTIEEFKNAGDSRRFFDSCYAYAVFPTVGEGGFVVGAALGKGRVYVRDKLVGDASMTQVSAGLQIGGKAYSQIVFFEDKRALDEFETGTFEFQAGTSAVAITAAAGASAGTNGVQASASGSENNATAVGAYNKGVAVFTIAKGGLMYAATLAGQRFSYTPRQNATVGAARAPDAAHKAEAAP